MARPGGGIGEIAEIDDRGAAKPLLFEDFEELRERKLPFAEESGAGSGARADGIRRRELPHHGGEILRQLQRVFPGGDEAGGIEIETGPLVIDALDDLRERSGDVSAQGQCQPGGIGVLRQIANGGDKGIGRRLGIGQRADIERHRRDAQVLRQKKRLAGVVERTVNGRGIGQRRTRSGDADRINGKLLGRKNRFEVATGGLTEKIRGEFRMARRERDPVKTRMGSEIKRGASVSREMVDGKCRRDGIGVAHA